MENIAFFKEKKYLHVKNVISLEIRDILTQYALFDEIQDYKNEDMQGLVQVPNAHSKYADPAMEAMLLYLHPLIEKYTELELYPTYSFYRVYRNGDELKTHIDRPSCEISVTACFNYSYDSSKYAWPIIMDGNKINMIPGDIVIYRGIDLEHSREKFIPPENDWHVQAFFHYVDANGKYADYKFDKRDFVGQIISNKKRYIEFV